MPDTELSSDHMEPELGHPPPTSELLIHLVEQGSNDEMTVGELIDGLGGRAFSIILLLLTLPIAVPGPPGLPMVFGVPLLILTAQLWLGRPAPWLPAFVRRRRFSRTALLMVLRKVRPTLSRLESICRPRLAHISGEIGQRWIGAFFFVCSIVLTNPVPIPFSHLPLAVALMILSLGFVERDGAVMIAGAVGAVAGIVINLSLTGGVVVLGFKALHLG
ncbi:MAG TPA: exopolysaccharide biosynthesis protein [Alphaproteobacteria bacterium]|jgi:hypothetical protein|nr:exopolysaccharide biosynthesis protein [Alphaproteobacteria bacterium]